MKRLECPRLTCSTESRSIIMATVYHAEAAWIYHTPLLYYSCYEKYFRSYYIHLGKCLGPELLDVHRRARRVEIYIFRWRKCITVGNGERCRKMHLLYMYMRRRRLMMRSRPYDKLSRRKGNNIVYNGAGCRRQMILFILTGIFPCRMAMLTDQHQSNYQTTDVTFY